MLRKTVKNNVGVRLLHYSSFQVDREINKLFFIHKIKIYFFHVKVTRKQLSQLHFSI